MNNVKPDKREREREREEWPGREGAKGIFRNNRVGCFCVAAFWAMEYNTERGERTIV